MTIVNDETIAIVNKAASRAARRPGEPQLTEPKGWPGHEFSTMTDEGKALLGMSYSSFLHFL